MLIQNKGIAILLFSWSQFQPVGLLNNSSTSLQRQPLLWWIPSLHWKMEESDFNDASFILLLYGQW